MRDRFREQSGSRRYQFRATSQALRRCIYNGVILPIGTVADYCPAADVVLSRSRPVLIRSAIQRIQAGCICRKRESSCRSASLHRPAMNRSIIADCSTRNPINPCPSTSGPQRSMNSINKEISSLISIGLDGKTVTSCRKFRISRGKPDGTERNFEKNKKRLQEIYKPASELVKAVGSWEGPSQIDSARRACGRGGYGERVPSGNVEGGGKWVGWGWRALSIAGNGRAGGRPSQMSAVCR